MGGFSERRGAEEADVWLDMALSPSGLRRLDRVRVVCKGAEEGGVGGYLSLWTSMSGIL